MFYIFLGSVWLCSKSQDIAADISVAFRSECNIPTLDANFVLGYWASSCYLSSNASFRFRLEFTVFRFFFWGILPGTGLCNTRWFNWHRQGLTRNFPGYSNIAWKTSLLYLRVWNWRELRILQSLSRTAEVSTAGGHVRRQLRNHKK